MKRIAVYYDTEKKDEDGKWQRGEAVLEFDVSQTVRLSIAISDGEYPTDYTASLSFKTGSAAPETSYIANSNTLVWVGSECSVSGSSSVFAPIANKVYDIVFYFNGANFVGLVNGYSVPAEAEA